MNHHEHPHAGVSRIGRDPVCGMTVDLDHPKGGKTVFEGREIGFCSTKCKAKFKADPHRYVGEQRAPEPSAPGTKWVCPMDPEVESDKPGACPKCGMALEPATPVQTTRVEYTCPMHPEIVRDAPGSCPICGMALEPRTVTLEEDNAELATCRAGSG
jgi:Cu+-exporting ATPase